MEINQEWCAITTMSPFRYYTPHQEIFTDILNGKYKNSGGIEFINLTDVFTESIEARELRLVKWQSQYQAFQGVVPIRVDHITSICKIQRNSRFEDLLKKFAEDPSLDYQVIKSL